MARLKLAPMPTAASTTVIARLVGRYCITSSSAFAPTAAWPSLPRTAATFGMYVSFALFASHS
jgi:hypothetical protein